MKENFLLLYKVKEQKMKYLQNFLMSNDNLDENNVVLIISVKIIKIFLHVEDDKYSKVMALNEWK